MTKPTLVQDCPLGAHLNNYWVRLSSQEQQMEFDEQGLYSLTIQKVALDVASRLPGDTILDAFCGVGGNAIAFARSGKRVITCDLDSDRLDMARRNAFLFGEEVVQRILFCHADARELLKESDFDGVFLDMPWGGVDYWKKQQFTLEDFDPDGKTMLSLAFARVNNVALKLPKTFDMNELTALKRPECTVVRDTTDNDEHLGFTCYFS